MHRAQHCFAAIAPTILGLVLGSATAGAATWHVDDDTCPAAGDGSAATPFCSIQAGIDAATDADEVLVEPGTYGEMINLSGKAITVRSSAGPAATIIDATGLGGSVITCNTGESAATVIEGFTLTGGDGGYGGGVSIDGAGPTVRACVLTENTGDWGGGIALRNGGVTLIEDCTISNNQATGYGGAIYGLDADGVFRNVEIVGNDGGSQGGILYGLGIHGTANVVFDGCTLSQNTPDGILALDGVHVELDGCLVTDNEGPTVYVASGASANVTSSTFRRAFGAPVVRVLPGGAAVVTNSTFVGNNTYLGSTVEGNADTAFTNCTFSGNRCRDYVALDGVFENCLVWANLPSDEMDQSVVRFSLVGADLAGEGLINADPRFVRAPNPGANGWDGIDDNYGDLRLRSDSPCIDAGDSFALPVGMVTDGAGAPRKTDSLCTYDTGIGPIPIVDMGAFEFQPEPLCGDGVCAGGETCDTCHCDCGSCCGNGICDSGEDCFNCGQDCSCAPLTVPQYYATIGEAIFAARDGDTVLVSPGTYHEVLDFSGRAITVRSFAGPEATTIDGSELGRTVVTFATREGPDSQLEGFTITGGVGSPGALGEVSVGGGVYVYNATPTIRDCVIEENEAVMGGGLYATSEGLTLERCTFRHNQASQSGGGMRFDGWSFTPTVTVADCVFSENTGTGMTLYDVSTATIDRSYVLGNSASGIYAFSAGLTVRNSVFVGNRSGSYGGALQVRRDWFTDVINCTFANNTAREGGAFYSDADCRPTIASSIFQFNSADIGNDLSRDGQIDLRYSDLDTGGSTFEGQIVADPRFLRNPSDGGDGFGDDPATPDVDEGANDDYGDLRLQLDSPCIDAGSNDDLPIEITVDLEGQPRLRDDFRVPDSGSGSKPIVDMGAYEIQPPFFLGGDLLANRYFNVAFQSNLTSTAVAVTIVSVPGFPELTGTTLWLGPPHAEPEEDSSDPGRTFVAAGLQCDPYYTDWSTYDLVYVYGAEIMPSSTYTFQEYQPGGWVGVTEQAATGQLGDVAEPFANAFGAPPQPDFKDVAAVVAKFMGDPAAPVKGQTQLQPNVVIPDRAVSFKDIATVVTAFLGVTYVDLADITGPCTCPSAVTCGAMVCSGDLECGTGFCIDGLCTDACGRCTP